MTTPPSFHIFDDYRLFDTSAVPLAEDLDDEKGLHKRTESIALETLENGHEIAESTALESHLTPSSTSTDTTAENYDWTNIALEDLPPLPTDEEAGLFAAAALLDSSGSGVAVSTADVDNPVELVVRELAESQPKVTLLTVPQLYTLVEFASNPALFIDSYKVSDPQIVTLYAHWKKVFDFTQKEPNYFLSICEQRHQLCHTLCSFGPGQKIIYYSDEEKREFIAQILDFRTRYKNDANFCKVIRKLPTLTLLRDFAQDPVTFCQENKIDEAGMLLFSDSVRALKQQANKPLRTEGRSEEFLLTASKLTTEIVQAKIFQVNPIADASNPPPHVPPVPPQTSVTGKRRIQESAAPSARKPKAAAPKQPKMSIPSLSIDRSKKLPLEEEIKIFQENRAQILANITSLNYAILSEAKIFEVLNKVEYVWLVQSYALNPETFTDDQKIVLDLFCEVANIYKKRYLDEQERVSIPLHSTRSVEKEVFINQAFIAISDAYRQRRPT